MKNRSTKLVARKAVESLCILLSKFSACPETRRKSPVHVSLLFLAAILSSPVSATVASDGSSLSNKLQPHPQLQEVASSKSLAREIVFIDSAVEDQSLLIKAVRPDAEVILLSPDVDGVSQIAQSLRDRSDISAIHIVSHGHAGQLLLGSSNLNSNTLRSYLSEINTISAALSKDADILLYGCNVAQGDNGKAFISKFAEMTNADVAASENVTGDAEKGGDWVLENRQGEVQAGVVFSQKGLAGYEQLLATPVITSMPVTSVDEDAVYIYIITATDTEHALTYSAQTKPSWLSFDEVTQELTGTPDNDDVDVVHNVVLEVTDGVETVQQSFKVEVVNTNDAATGQPVIVGAATEDVALSVDTNNIDDVDGGVNGFTYQWESGGVDVSTNSTYKLSQSDVGKAITVTVIFTDDGGAIETVTSNEIGPVANVSHDATGQPVIVGAATEDVTLSVDTNNIDDVDGGVNGFTYRWESGGVDVSTNSTYKLSQSDVGKTITVTVIFTDDGGTEETVTSDPTAEVRNTNDPATGKPVIVGAATEDVTLSVDTSNIIDEDGGVNGFTYQWKSGGVNVSTGSTYKLLQTDVGKTITVTVIFTDDGGTEETVTSNPTAEVANVNDAGNVSISGTLQEDKILTANVSDPDGVPTTGITYQWKADDAIIGGNSKTYQLTQSEVGKDITVKASYTDVLGGPETPTSAPVGPVENLNDTPTGKPDIIGDLVEDVTLSVSTTKIIDEDGGVNGFTYQWKSAGVNVGNKKSTYRLRQTDVGKFMTVAVTYTDNGGTTETVISDAKGPVTNVNDKATGQPVIVGEAIEGVTLSVNTSNINDEDGGVNGFTYQWKSGGLEVGASDTYKLLQTDVNKKITVTVIFTDDGGAIETVTSNEIGPVANVNNDPVGIPIITGNVSKHGELTADASPIEDEDGIAEGAFNYQWQRNGVNIDGAVSVTYTLGLDDVGTKIKVVVTYVDNGGKTETVPSLETGVVSNRNAEPVGIPVITGIVRENETLGVDTSDISDRDGGVDNFTYQWKSDDEDVATSDTYTLSQKDVGKLVTVFVTYIDDGDTTETVISGATVPVVNVNDEPTGKPVIIGDAIEGVELTVDIEAIDDIDGLGDFSYQWLRINGEAILEVGNGISYTLVQADVAAQIRLVISFTDGQGKLESVTSLPTVPVANVNDSPVGLPIIIGSPVQGSVLIVDTLSVSDIDGLGVLSFQWLRDGEPIPDAISPSYTLVQEDVETFVSILVSYIDGQLTPESVIGEMLDPISNVNDLGVVIIDSDPAGLAIDGELLSVISLTDIDGISTNDINYQWLRDGVEISDAIGEEYRIQTIDLRTFISLRVTYTDDFKENEIIFSNAIGPIFPDVPKVVPPDALGPVVSTGWFTFVEIEKTTQATAVDGFDGVLIPFSDSNGQFRPGVTGVIWSAVDSADNVGTAIQDVKVIPLVDLNKGQISAEGASVQVRVALNGNAISYPVTVPYTVSGSADANDHTLLGGSVIINEPAADGLPEGLINFAINTDGLAEGTETVAITLGAPSNAVLGLVKTHTVEIVEGNVAPLVSLSASQSGVGTMLKVDPSGNEVIVSAVATDVNGDGLGYDWSGTDVSIVNMDVTNKATFTFDPVNVVPGFYTFHVSVSDGSASVVATLTLEVLEQTSMLSTKDSDGDGIVDYLDMISASHILQQKQSVSNAFLIQTEPGLKLSLGETAFRANNSQSMVTSQDVVDYAFNGVTGIELLDEIENIGGYFDFIVDGIPIAGDSVQIVLPQLAPLPKLPVYRKLTPSGWQDFVEDEKNTIHSVAGSEGYCPPPGDAAYQPGLSEGRWCVQLTIEDGGPNDLDRLVNNSVTDPGGVSRFLASVSVKSSGGGGGATNPLLLLSVFFMLLYYRNGKHLVRKVA